MLSVAAIAPSLVQADSAAATVGVGPSVTFTAFDPVPANIVSGRRWFSASTITFAITVNANGEPGPPQIQCKLDDGELISCPNLVQLTPTSYTFEYSFSPFEDGAHDVTVVAEDNEGDPTDVTTLIGIDSQDPLLNFDRPVGPVIRTTLPFFTSEFTVFDGFAGVSPTAECRLDGAEWEPCVQVYAQSQYGIFKHPVAGMDPGVHSFDVRAIDTVNRQTVKSLDIHVQSPGSGVEVEMTSSTTQSAAHPDVRIDLRNNTAHDVNSYSFMLPDGFYTSLAGVPGQAGDGSRCPYPSTPDFFTGCEESVKQSSRVGSVRAVLDIGGHDVVLTGSAHVVDPQAPNPAAFVFAVEAKIGGLDFGTLVIPARAIIEPVEGNPMVYEEIVNGPARVNTIVDDVPTSLEDPDHGTVEFTLKQLTVDLQGQVAGGPQPFLTNPSSCDAGMGIATVITDDSETHLSQPEYTATGCDTVAFAPSIDSVALTSNDMNDLVGMTMNVHLPDRHSTIEGMQIDLPRSLTTNGAAYAVKCTPSQTMRLDPEDALNGGCPDETRVGTATIDSPLFTEPISGIVFLEDSGGPIPNLYINVRDLTLGVNARLRASNETVPGDPNGHIRTSIDVFSDSGPRSISSFPVTDFTLDLPGTTQGPGGTLSPMFRVSGDCSPTDHAFARFSSHARPGFNLHETISPPIAFDGCNQNTQIAAHESLFTPTKGGTTSSTSAAFRLNWTGGGSVTFRCSLDGADYDTNCGIGSGVTTGVVQFAGLADGVHKLVVTAGGSPDEDVYLWKVDTSSPRDTTAPTAPLITSGPSNASTTADGTPTWQFSSGDGSGTAAGNLKFQCRLDGGAFVACGTGSPGSFTSPELPSAAAQFNGVHDFSVRAEDQSGNVSAATTVTFTVDRPLAANFSATASTYVAGAHPAISLTFGNESSQDIRDVTLSLPDEMTIDPNSVDEVCTFVDAVAANCPAGSQMASAEAVVQVDRSRLTLPGAVFLVEAALPTSLNRMALVIDPTLGSIDFGSRIVAIGDTLARTSPAGVDFRFTSLPVTVLDVPKTAPMTFRLRSLKLDYSQSPDGALPQFTNPPACATRSFGASVTSYTDNNVTGSSPFVLTGCAQPSPTVQITAPAPSSVTNDATPTLNFTVSDPGAACTLQIDSVNSGSVTSGATLPTLADGNHTVVVNCTNATGGGSDDSQFKVDTTAPSVSISAPASGSTTSDSTPPLDYAVSDAGDSSPSCNLADGSNLGPYAPGSRSVTVTCTDDAGNAGSATNNFTVTAAGFSPALTAGLSGRGGAALAPGSMASLSLNLTTAAGDEGATAFSLSMPPILRIDVLTLPDALCEISQANAGACPAAARVGSATGQTTSAGSLSGSVYLLRSAASSTPDLAVLFGGQSNWLRGTRSAGGDGRLSFAFAGQPGALPLTGISLLIDGLFSLTKSACGQVDLSLPASVTSEGSKSATLNSQVSVEGGGLPAVCAAGAIAKSKFKNKLKRSTLAITVTSTDPKAKKLSITLPKGLKQVKKALAKKLIVKADGKRLQPKCFKFRSVAKLEVGLCGKPASKIELSFKSGTLVAVKKLKASAKMTIVVTPQSGAAQTLNPALTAR